MRTEQDSLGQVQLEGDCYYGIHTLRAKENFPLPGRLHKEVIVALADVKKACAMANAQAGILDKRIADMIVLACDDIRFGKLHDQFVVAPLAGGAGTSFNMNANEVIANRAIEYLGGQLGDYSVVHPIDHVNLSQSTNDVFPTAVRLAAIRLLKPVSEAFAKLQEALQQKENAFADIIKVGRTQLQDAVPVTVGQEFGAWAQAVARDRWRLYKAEERLRQTNLGGTAVGTGLNAPRKYTFLVTDILRQNTGIGLARAEYLMDVTQNADVFVEVSGLLKTAAVNLSKLANDLRLLSSGPWAGIGELQLPERQAGSSIMPGKVNPVIPEAVNQIAFRIMGNDLTISNAAMSGQLELNAFLPVICDSLMEMLELLQQGIMMLIDHCIQGITVNERRCQQLLEQSGITVTALIDHIGYELAAELAKECRATGRTIRELASERVVLEPALLEAILDSVAMTTPGVPGTKFKSIHLKEGSQ